MFLSNDVQVTNFTASLFVGTDKQMHISSLSLSKWAYLRKRVVFFSEFNCRSFNISMQLPSFTLRAQHLLTVNPAYFDLIGQLNYEVQNNNF